MDLRLLREWIRNPLLLEGVSGRDLDGMLLEFPAFEAGQLLSLQRMKINHSSKFAKAMASYTAMTDQAQWLYRAMERHTAELSNPDGGESGEATDDTVLPEVQTRLDWFSLLGRVAWESLEADELDSLYSEYTQSDYLDASSEWPVGDFATWNPMKRPNVRDEDHTLDHDSKVIGDENLPPVYSELDIIRQMAANSLDLNKVPVSESLAELYLEQGQKAMAARIYRRLMLRFPAKSGYFQSRLDHLDS